MTVTQAVNRLVRAVGLMSGTSMDAVDVALIETDGEGIVRRLAAGERPYRDDERAAIRAALPVAAGLADRAARPDALARAERIVTEVHAEAVETFLADHAIDPATIDVVGFHGQTVFHAPERALTIQIGDGPALAARLGIDVVYDLRAADMLAGGQGAPLVPAYHRALAEAAGLDLPVVLLNLGGVGNITFVGADGTLIAFDTGPANALVDDLLLERLGRPMDEGGRIAAAGHVDSAALAALLDHPYFAAPLPKSLDRNAFSRAPVAALSTEDAAATLVAFTAETVAAGLRLVPQAPNRIVVCGGGARNPTLLAAVAAATGVATTTADALGWSSAAMEAEAFGYLAVRSLKGLPLTFPGTTGVAAPTLGGVLVRTPRRAAA
nr:anhydro-N-acetylmuramic acid kinase [Segnochrobactrum spirostomi]